MKEYYIYVHTNKINGKKYVGQTCQEPEERWSNGGGYLKKKKNGEYMQPAIANAIVKYGWDSFEHEIVASNLSKEEADNLEKSLIAELETRDSRKGYNITSGGEGIAGLERTDEWKKKIGDANRGKKMSDEQKAKLSEIRKGKTPSKQCLERTLEVHRKPVMCIETGIIYAGVREANRQTGINSASICTACKNSNRTAGGFHWAYYEAEKIAA